LEKIYKKPYVQILHDVVITPLNMRGGDDMEYIVGDRYRGIVYGGHSSGPGLEDIWRFPQKKK
jgi:hypothetical protein